MPQARFYGFAADRRHYKLIAPKGETTHYSLCVADAPTKCVRCAPQSGNPQSSGQRPVKLKNPPALGPVHLKNLFLGTLRTQDTKCPSFTISPLTWPPEACILLSN